MKHACRRCWSSRVATILTLLMGAGFAYGEADSAYQLDSMTVTAEKRDENLQDVPMAITAFSAKELEDAKVETIADVIRMVPGLSFETTGMHGYSAISYRGINNSPFTSKNPFVIFQDGVPFDSTGDCDLDLINIERIEVLRGPQGIMYGKNAIGGAINIISKKPGNTLDGKIGAEAGENETYAIQGVVDGPVLKDTLFLGVSAKYYETRGYMENDAPGQDYSDSEKRTLAKGHLRWLPANPLEINLHAGINQNEGGSARTIRSDEVQYHEFKDPEDKSDTDIFYTSMNINFTTNTLEINSVSTYKKTEKDFLENLSYAGSGMLDCYELSDTTSLTQELRIQSLSSRSRLKWLMGVFYSNEEKDAQKTGTIYDMTDYYGYNMESDRPYERCEETIAAFGQMTVPLFHSVNVTAGLRYELTRKELDYTSYTTRTDTDQLLSTSHQYWEDDWSVFLPKGVLSWNVNESKMLYFSVATGYLAGGFNQFDDNKDTAKFDAQTSLNYEVGAKSTWLDNRIVVNAALFYVDIDDMHVWGEPSPGNWIATNAAKAHSQGVEIEAKARPLQGLDIAASFSYTDGEFDEYENYTGNRLLQTPEYAYHFYAQYKCTFGFFARGEIEGYGKTYYDDANNRKQDPYSLVNAKAGYDAAGWRIYLYADNIFDKAYFSSIRYGYYTVGEPRTIGVVASFSF